MKPPEPKEVKKEKIEIEIEELQKQVEEKNNAYLRALADYHNLERRSLTNAQNEIRRLMTGFLKQLIEIKSDLDQAEAFHQIEGLKLIKNKFAKVLERYQVVEFNPEGKEFSPETMECVQLQSSDKENIVLKVLEKGYLYQNELLKPAKVVVSQLTVPPTKTEKK